MPAGCDLRVAHGFPSPGCWRRDCNLTPDPDPDHAQRCRLQRCRLYTCDPSVRHKEMEPSLAAAKTFAQLRVSSGLRRASLSSSDNGSPAAAAAGAATPAAAHGAMKREDQAEIKPATTGTCRTCTFLVNSADTHRGATPCAQQIPGP